MVITCLRSAEKALLLGEARYTSRAVGSDVLAELGDKATGLTPSGWQAHLALFARSGFTAELRERAEREGVILVALVIVSATCSAIW